MGNQDPMATPIDNNRSLLNRLFKFKINSTLKPYITRITRVEKNIYSLAEVLTILKNKIRQEGMFDENNPSIILCSRQLEYALNMRALHVTEVRNLVLLQLDELPDQISLRQIPVHSESSGLSSLYRPQQTPPSHINSIGNSASPTTSGPSLMRDVNQDNSFYTNKDRRFTLKPNFLKVIQSVLNPDKKDQTLFSYEELTLLLSKYILSNKNKFFDQRNIKLAMVHDDPLGTAFGVQAFHRCQVNNLLKSQLIPSQYDADEIEMSLQDNSWVIKLPIPQNTIPTVQRATFSQTLPAFASTFCARDPSPKQPESERYDECSANHNSGSRSEYTMKTNNDDHEEDQESDDQIDLAYEIEYDVISEEEGGRPPQANGIGKEFSSAENTDTDMDLEARLDSTMIEPTSQEDTYLADSENESETIKTLVQNIKNSKCVSCRIQTDSNLPYCKNCWEIRKEWVERPKGKKKARTNVRAQDQLANENPAIGALNTLNEGKSKPRTGQDSPNLMETPKNTERQQSYEVMDTTGTSVPIPGAVDESETDDMFVDNALEYTLPISNRHKIPTVRKTSEHKKRANPLCMMCYKRPKDASFIHGRIGHQISCYPCAKKHWKEKAQCPVCRRKVEKLVRIIQN